MTIEIPEYLPYKFNRITYLTKKTLNTDYYIIDNITRSFKKGTLEIFHENKFRTCYNIHEKDPNKSYHLQGTNREEEMVNFEEGQTVSIIPMGDSVIVSPKRLELDEARREIRRIAKQAGCSLDELIAGLKEEREDLFREVYGKKNA